MLESIAEATRPDDIAALDLPYPASAQAHADPNFIRARLARAAALADSGLRIEARGACADLLFEFQPLIAAHPDLVTQFESVLHRCGATALRLRFLLAVHGDASCHDASRINDWHARRAPRPATEGIR